MSRRYVRVVAGGEGLGMLFMLESIGTWSEVTMTEELMIGFRVKLTCVMRRSRVGPCLCVGMCICCIRLLLSRRSENWMDCESRGSST